MYIICIKSITTVQMCYGSLIKIFLFTYYKSHHYSHFNLITYLYLASFLKITKYL